MRQARLAVSLLWVVLCVSGCLAQEAKPWERQGTRAGEEIVGPDGGKMVWVPAGECMMGSPLGEGEADERPRHRVRITKGFWLGKCEVTNEQYRTFCQHTGRQLSRHCSNGPKLPVVCVTWDDAKAYCDRYGLCLPTEAQWEWAARGPEGRRYPWGNEWDAKKCCNLGYELGYPGLMDVGSLPAGDSWCQASDLAGDVWEWCADWYDSEYYANSPKDDPPGPTNGKSRVLRGGWFDRPDEGRSAVRYWADPDRTAEGNGFRVSFTPLPPQGVTAAVATPEAPPVPQSAQAWLRQGTRAGEAITGPDGGVLVWVPAGEFVMGSPDREGEIAEHPEHRVRITRGFWLGKYELTNEQYHTFCQATGRAFPPSSKNDPRHPVVCVSWEDAQAYCAKYGLSLPTEAQWEYGARGREGFCYPWGDEWDVAKCCNVSNQGTGTPPTMEVGSLPEGNAWCGASDMAGNVYEWCADWHDEGYYAKSPDSDPTGPTTERTDRVLRGGSVAYPPRSCRSAFRSGADPGGRYVNTGFRVARVP